LYQKKYTELGIEIKNKTGNGIGMGRINEKEHIMQIVM
jgi:hypothetical protein